MKRDTDDQGQAIQVPSYASFHDFRRSFGERWAALIMPPQLMELMRHESIETTLRYYVGQNAQKTAGILWEAHRKAGIGSADKTADTYKKSRSPELETGLKPEVF